MREFQFFKIDAFTAPGSSGNPAGMVWLEPGDNISTDEMLRIAKELKGFVNEVAYVMRGDDKSFQISYYSSERELDFCGHATIAVFHELLQRGSNKPHKEEFCARVNAGDITIWNRLVNEGAIYISAPRPKFRSTHIDRTALADALDCRQHIIDEDHPVTIVNAGLETVVTPIRNFEELLRLNPRFERLKSYSEANQIDTVLVFCKETAMASHRYRTRVFCPSLGYLEDPASGSGNSALGYYLLAHNLWRGEPITIEQNGDRDRPNLVRIRKDHVGRIQFGGGAITRIQGRYLLA